MNKLALLRARFAAPRLVFWDGAATLDGLTGHPPGTALDVVVSACLLHELVCEPGLPLAGDAALHAYARQQFAHYFGAVAQRWPLATWTAGDQRGASALHGLDWAALSATAEAGGVRLTRVRPAWAAALHTLAAKEPVWRTAPQATLAWVEGVVLTLVQPNAGVTVRQQRLAAPTQAALDEALAGLAVVSRADLKVLSLGLDGRSASPDLAWFTATEPVAAWPQPDFFGPRVARSRVAWPLAAIGVLTLGVAFASAWDSHRLLDASRQRLAQISKGRPSVATVAVKPKVAPAAQAVPKQASEVQALLQQAWEPLLANVEQAGAEQQPAGQLNWLALDFTAGRNELRLEGLTQDKLRALQLVDRLAAAPGWQAVVLSRFQTGEQGLSGQRFELNARLAPALLRPELPVVMKEKR